MALFSGLHDLWSSYLPWLMVATQVGLKYDNVFNIAVKHAGLSPA